MFFKKKKYNEREKLFLYLGAISGALSVLLGAFGAHAIREKVSEYSFEIFQTAVQYQVFNSIMVLVVALMIGRFSKFKSATKMLNYSAYCFITGLILFCGSLYLLATQSLMGLDLSFLGPVTPIGGLLFFLAWVFIILSVGKAKA